MSIFHSTEALNIINRFHGSDCVLYVEGDDDILFWKFFFTKFCPDIKIKYDPVGSCEELNKYIKKITDNQAMILVARDLDHSDFMGTKIDNEQVLYTYGYSIENTLYCHKKIASIISNSYKVDMNFESITEQWMCSFAKSVEELLVYDIASVKYKKGVSVFGDSCQRFLSSDKKWIIDNTKVYDFIATIQDKYDQDEINSVRKLIESSGKEKWSLIKGHFLTHGIANFISDYISHELSKAKIKLNENTLYALTIEGCTYCDCNCVHEKYIEEQINDAIIKLNLTTAST